MEDITLQHNVEVTHVRPGVYLLASSPFATFYFPILLLTPVAQNLFGRAQQFSEVEIRLIVVSNRRSHRITALLARSALDRPV